MEKNQMGTVDLMHLWQCIFPTQNGAAAIVAGRASDVIAEPPSLAATCTGPENWERANSRAEGTYHIFSVFASTNCCLPTCVRGDPTFSTPIHNIVYGTLSTLCSSYHRCVN